MEPSKEAIAVRITRLNRQILGKVTGGSNKLKKTIDRESLLDALTVLYDECNDDPVKKCDDLVKAFVDKYRSTLAELRRARVCLSDFDIVQTIGRGHFGEVHMVREKHTSDVYALKTLRKERAPAEDERDVLAACAQPWLPRLQYAFQDATNLYLVMELCNGGDLAGLLSRRSQPLAERDAAFYVAEVAHALKALHAMGYVHRDVKPPNVLLDRCGHVKLGDLGSCARLAEGAAGAPVVTADYVAPELLAQAHCAATHSVCLHCARGIAHAALSACDYWSLGVMAFELVTLRRPFSSDDEDSIAQILANIQRYESDPDAEPPFDPLPSGPSSEWRSLVGGLLRVQPSRRYNYLDTLQHAALQHLASHSIRDQAPPWVPALRGPEDAACFSPAPRAPAPPSAAPFRARPPFAGQLPFVGYSYVAPNEHDDNSGGFNSSHDCTAINLATFKSSEKLAAMRGREIASLQSKLAAAEAAVGAEAEKTRREADAETERMRARLQAEITALSLQNRRLERQIEVEKEERMALERTNQELTMKMSKRNSLDARASQTTIRELEMERDGMREEKRQLEAKVAELQAECARATAAADSARAQQRHYKDIILSAQELRHRRLTEINVRAIDSIAKERALRRQTLTGGETESRENATRLANAEAQLAKESRAKEQTEKKLASVEEENRRLQSDLDEARRELARSQEQLGEKRRLANTTGEQAEQLQHQLAQERVRVTSLLAQVQELERGVQEASRREAALEEQCARTEARLNERLEAAEARAAAALGDDVRHRERVNTLEQLVRQLEREVSSLESRATCPACAASHADAGRDPHSDTESVGDAAQGTAPAAEGKDGGGDKRGDARTTSEVTAQATVLKEQLERAEAQLQARAEEIAALRQEARTANLARWRKEREYNELSVETKSSARDLKRLEDRLQAAVEARKTAEQKASVLQSEMAILKPQHERLSRDVERLKEQLEKLQKTHEIVQAEVDRSRNDIRKLKSELQYSEKRRIHAEEQEELSSRERSQICDELASLRAHNAQLTQNNKALQEACTLLEEQLTDLEKLTDVQELKNKDLESDTQRIRAQLEAGRAQLREAEARAARLGALLGAAAGAGDGARDQLRHARAHLDALRERLESREARVAELEGQIATLEGQKSASEGALQAAMRRVRDLQEESAALRTRAHHYHALTLQLQASLDEAQEEIAAIREANEAATAWWRTRETKADATLRQQAKLIDFLQAKIEEAGRKKCSLSNKLFGRSGRRGATSPSMRRTNRELREEVERLRAKLASSSLNGDSCPPTPRSSTKLYRKQTATGNDATDSNHDENKLQIIWSDGTREKLPARVADGELVLTGGGRELRARLLSADADRVPQNEAGRAFTVELDDKSTAAVVCPSVSERAAWAGRLRAAPCPAPGAAPGPAPAARYRPAALCSQSDEPAAALCVGAGVVALGTSNGLFSLRGPVNLELDASVSPPRHVTSSSIDAIVAASGRALLLQHGMVLQGSLLALGSALRRASNLKPTFSVTKVALPDGTPPHLLKAISGDSAHGISAAVACRRRVFALRFDAASAEFKVSRSFTVDRPPSSVLLTPRSLFIAGEKPIRITLPSGAMESFAADEPTVAAAARRHSPPRAVLLTRADPAEILLCYAECGVFLDERGKRTRNVDPKWNFSVDSWEFVEPFLYLVGDDRVTIIYVNEEAYNLPPCTCDTASMASTASDCCQPETFTLNMKEAALLGTAPNGIIIRSKIEDGYKTSVVEGMAAFKSIGASVESLATISDKGSTTDLAQSDGAPSTDDISQQDVSHESVEATTGFLADIRKRAKQLRLKNLKEQSQEDAIKKILTNEVGLKPPTLGRKSPAMISEYDSDESCEETENGTDTTQKTAELCAEMFSRQVRFQ